MEWKYLGRYECIWEELVGMDELQGLCDKVTSPLSRVVDESTSFT